MILHPEIILNPFSLGVPKGRQGRRGIALLVVIGLTAMMMLLGAAFIIYMRTERVASGNFKSDVRARQLLHVALARAMDAVEATCNNAIYPPFDVLYSATNGYTVTNALTGWGATNYLPRGAFLNPGWDTAVNNPVACWTNLAGGSENVRYAFVVLNVSGLFDANQVGRSGNVRGAGTNVQEICLDDMPECKNDNVYTNRNVNSFDNLPDLFTNTFAKTNFVVFQPYVRTTNLVDLSGSVDDLKNRKGDIVTALTACGIASPDTVFNYLLDYRDTDDIPQDLGSACTEMVPMINEIKKEDKFTRRVVGSVTNLKSQTSLNFECWYPFKKPFTNNAYCLSYQVTFSLEPAKFAQLPPTNGTLVLYQDQSIDGASSEYGTTDQIIIKAPDQPLDDSNAGETIKINANISLQVHQGIAGGPEVDAAPYPTNLTISLTGLASDTLGTMGLNIPCSRTRGLEYVDPRCNWLNVQGTARQFYFNTAASIGTINPRTQEYFGKNFPIDSNTEMYVANRELVSVGELTYLMRSGNPTYSGQDFWTTIRLIPPPGHEDLIDPIFDHFTIGTNRSMGATLGATAIDWGLVNANSRTPAIWDTVFTDMPLKRPAGPDAVGVVASPVTLENAWLNTNNNPWVGTMTNITDFCRVGWEGNNLFAGTEFAPFTPLEKESFFINSAGLLGVRQNSFVILLCGEPVRSIFSGTTECVSPLSGIRAVATVWRDPVAPPGEPHHWFVRSFDILKNQ